MIKATKPRGWTQKSPHRNKNNYATILFAPEDPPGSGIAAYNVGATFGKSEYQQTLKNNGFPTGTILKIKTNGKTMRIYNRKAFEVEERERYD